MEPAGSCSRGASPCPSPPSCPSASRSLEALMHAHSRDVLHQDLSPANVLVSRSGSAKLIDFGMAGKRAAPGAGNVVGTPAFLSPEHVAGEPSTARSDLFSFGSLLYFACRGEPLFDPGEDNGRLRETFLAIEKARWQPPLDKLRALPRPALPPGEVRPGRRRSGVPAARHAGALVPVRRARPGRRTPCGASCRKAATVPRTGIRALGAGDPRSLPQPPLGGHATGRRSRSWNAPSGGSRTIPLLRDLLSTPPARAKSAPVTVEVAAPAGPEGAMPPALRRHRRTAWTLAPAPPPCRASVAFGAYRGRLDGRVPARHRPAASRPGRRRLRGVRLRRATASGETRRRRTGRGKAPAAATPPARTSTPPGLRASPGFPPSRPRPSLAVKATPAAEGARSVAARDRAGPRPPALSLAGPAGTRILVNDSLELTSPAPRGGWTLPAGLVNLVVTLPGGPRPISSSLFVASDTLYVLDLGGGRRILRVPQGPVMGARSLLAAPGCSPGPGPPRLRRRSGRPQPRRRPVPPGTASIPPASAWSPCSRNRAGDAATPSCSSNTWAWPLRAWARTPPPRPVSAASSNWTACSSFPGTRTRTSSGISGPPCGPRTARVPPASRGRSAGATGPRPRRLPGPAASRAPYGGQRSRRSIRTRTPVPAPSTRRHPPTPSAPCLPERRQRAARPRHPPGA